MRVALLMVCLSPPYWQYARNVIASARKFFLQQPLYLTHHQVDYFLWSDMPMNYGTKTFAIEAAPWPYPTLMRYHLFLKQEEELSKYDYIFYCDVDMEFVDHVGNEILGEGLTAALHPMYALKMQLWPPYEPNEKSAAYIKRPGTVVTDTAGKKRLMPTYFAGGFQGGRANDFISAMKSMRANIDQDFVNNYIAAWNDESHWNRYLFDNPPAVVLSPSYIYPDSLIDEYYVPIWGERHKPKLKTLTKSFSTSPQGAEALRKMLNNEK